MQIVTYSLNIFPLFHQLDNTKISMVHVLLVMASNVWPIMTFYDHSGHKRPVLVGRRSNVCLLLYLYRLVSVLRSLGAIKGQLDVIRGHLKANYSVIFSFLFSLGYYLSSAIKQYFYYVLVLRSLSHWWSLEVIKRSSIVFFAIFVLAG